jgi:class 3 adenylate cyclase
MALTGRPASSTHGFLFADLRGYTAYIDGHGAVAASGLLERFRTIVRAAVARHEGAEIRTEGDSFYVTFPSASLAVACALDIVTAAAADAADHPDDPIRVGVGVHAGEAVETPEGPVGTAVNIAARLCAIASPGEVVVSDTVRSLTRSVGEAGFIAIGRRTVKGIDEPLTLYRAVPAGSPLPAPRRSAPIRSRRGALAGGVVAIAVVGIGALAILASQGGPGATGGPSQGPSTGSATAEASQSGGPSTVTSSPSRAAPSRVDVAPIADHGRWSTDRFAAPFSVDLDAGTGWAAWEDQPDRVNLGDAFGAATTIALLEAVLDPPCRDVQPNFLEARPNGLMNWLESRDWIAMTDRRPYAVDRHVGQAARVEVPVGVSWTCPDGSTPATAQMFLMAGPAGETLGLGSAEAAWVVALDVNGRTVAVVTKPLRGSNSPLERLLPNVEELVQSIEFEER